MKKFTPHLLVFTIFLSLSLFVVHADNGDGTTPDSGGATTPVAQQIKGTIDNPFVGGNNLVDLFKTIIDKIILPIGGVVAVLAFIWSGFMYVTARGDEPKVKNATRALLYTSIGTAILLGAAVIADVLSNTIKQLRP